ncbi:Carboxylic ester hydrolase [Mycena venus]|uniref:Carboxylic ester hydrolase n=1 Tax=Mycena venus TaxID=2733690 RepID=A0A8H6YRQ4_9AGAR|nr:Carboxylic ester hydrolase [Mycena venus]
MSQSLSLLRGRDLITDIWGGIVDTSSNITTFLGIRYAAPPVDDLRFRAPQPPVFISDVQQTTEQPNQCWQVSIVGLEPTNPFRTRAVTNVSSEDCSFLSVYYPSDAQGVPVRGGRLPTIVYIHGGGYNSANFRTDFEFPNFSFRYLLGSSSQFRGSDLIKQSNHGVVFVIIQYRLGLFGFLAGSAVKNNGAPNVGLLDQEFALRWVNKQIAKFGGDPSQVTIWGESAGTLTIGSTIASKQLRPWIPGAGSVFQHVIANGGQTESQLFRAAISSSSFVPSHCTSAPDWLACLHAVDVSLLQAANLNINADTFFGTYPFAPVVDGTFIQQSPTKALAEGLVNGEALLAVINAHEGTIFVNASVPASANISEYALELFPDFGLAQASQVHALYADVGSPFDQAAAVHGDAIFRCPTYSLLRAFSGRSFKAEFAIPPGNHGMDLQYYFPSLAIDVPVLNYPTFFNSTRFINAFAQAFTAFAISRDPNIKLSKTAMPLWVPWNTAGRTEMVFNKTVANEPLVKPFRTENAVLERCRFWDSVSNLTGH